MGRSIKNFGFVRSDSRSAWRSLAKRLRIRSIRRYEAVIVKEFVNEMDDCVEEVESIRQS